MTKRRKQAVEVELTGEEFVRQTFDALTVAEDSIERLWGRAGRWKAVAKRWRKLAHATNPHDLPWLEFRRLIKRRDWPWKEKADD